MTVLTADGSFSQTYLKKYTDAQIVSIRKLKEAQFIDKLCQSKVVIHNAATLESTNLEDCLKRNFDFTRFVVNHLEKANPNVHLILLSSMSVLDPLNSQSYGDVIQMTPYAYSKFLAETYCLKSSLVNVSCVRFSTLFYSDPKKDGLSKLVDDAVSNGAISIYNHGTARRNFLPLPVAVDYVHKLANLKKVTKKTYTFAGPKSTSFKEIAEMLKKNLPDLRVDDVSAPPGPNVLADFNLADSKSLGQIKFSLEDEIISYMKALQT